MIPRTSSHAVPALAVVKSSCTAEANGSAAEALSPSPSVALEAVEVDEMVVVEIAKPPPHTQHTELAVKSSSSSPAAAHMAYV